MLQLHCCLVTWSCPSLCDPMDCSTPDFPVIHRLLKLAQTHVHCNSYNSAATKSNNSIKNGKKTGRVIFPKVMYKWSISIGKIFNFANHQRSINQITMRYHFTLIRMANIKNTRKTSVAKEVEKLESLFQMMGL